MAAMILCLLLSFVATVFGGVYPSYSKVDAVDYQGYNDIQDYSQDYSHFAPSLPAYSTVSYVLASGHSKPVSYSGFISHGRGHHDPGYSVQHRSEGFEASHKGDNYY